MAIDKRKLITISNCQTWFLSMSCSIHTLYLLLIFISISWNAYNTQQYRLLAERQSKFENILTKLLPSLFSIPSFDHESTTTEQWFNKISHLIQQLIFKDAIATKHQTKPSTVRILNYCAMNMGKFEEKITCFFSSTKISFRLSDVNEDMLKNHQRAIACVLRVKSICRETELICVFRCKRRTSLSMDLLGAGGFAYFFS